MKKVATLAAIAIAAFATPVLAADAPNAGRNQATPVFTHDQARSHLARQGYVNISPLTRDANGSWRGTATKGGKTTIVAVGFKNVAR